MSSPPHLLVLPSVDTFISLRWPRKRAPVVVRVALSPGSWFSAMVSPAKFRLAFVLLISWISFFAAEISAQISTMATGSLVDLQLEFFNQVTLNNKSRDYRQSDKLKTLAESGIYGDISHKIDLKITTISESTSFALVPAGPFQMGNAHNEGSGDGKPVCMVNVSAFYMEKTEVTKAEWDEVRTWGLLHGYTDLPRGGGKASNHPVVHVRWYDVIKWCNARSEKGGLEPCYRVGGNIMRTDFIEPTVDWTATGYRLPTEAEWEKAARGGLSGQRFPWGNTIHLGLANYEGSTDASYDLGPAGYHRTYAVGSEPYTSPVGRFAANGYGLYDMAGNVCEWCWDWYGQYISPMTDDPRGPSSGSLRVGRGGSWFHDASRCRVAYRLRYDPRASGNIFGFRSVRGL
jgi:sulfatase modifying factor 1